MSKTVYLLFAQHEKAVLPLEDICEEYFDMNRKTAYQHAATQILYALPKSAKSLLPI